MDGGHLLVLAPELDDSFVAFLDRVEAHTGSSLLRVMGIELVSKEV
jgi:hypothetical protein